jgi:hypothetical protein
VNLYDTEYYRVVFEDDFYKVINKVTERVEGEEVLLPKAMISAQTWNDSVARLYQKQKEASNVVVIGVKGKDSPE